MTNISPEARLQIDTHLDAIETELSRAGWSRQRRRALVDEVEGQISDMLRDHTDVTADDVGRILTKLDPPSAYGDHATPTPPAQTIPIPEAEPVVAALPCRKARWSAFIVLVTVAIFAVGIFPPNGQNDPGRIGVMFLFFAIGSIYGTSLGWIATATIGRSRGMLRGIPSAAIGALLCPSILLFLLSCLVWNFVTVVFSGDNMYSDRKQAVMFLGAIPTALVLESILVFAFVWLVRGAKHRPRGAMSRLQPV